MKFFLLLKLCNFWIVTSLFLKISYCTLPCFSVVIGDGSSNDYIENIMRKRGSLENYTWMALWRDLDVRLRSFNLILLLEVSSRDQT